MTGTGFLLILIGLFIVINASNFVGVIQGNKVIGQYKPPVAPPLPTSGAGGNSQGK